MSKLAYQQKCFIWASGNYCRVIALEPDLIDVETEDQSEFLEENTLGTC